ncbi:MAG: hypothetical protein VYD72_03255 [Chloroflexota bacterium]|jgi:hypothetical protein|nr:hypothetical protein [Chloroflexota bacterium]
MNVKEYTPEEKEKIKAKIIEELDKAFDVNRYGKGTPLWMNLLFLLRRFNKGNYYGTLELKVLGTSCNDIKEKERTFKLLEIFPEP